MDDLTRHEIIDLPISDKEKNHTSRKRLGFYVFVSNYFQRFGLLNINEEKETLLELRVWDEHDDVENDELSLESTLTQPNDPDYWKAKVFEIM